MIHGHRSERTNVACAGINFIPSPRCTNAGFVNSIMSLHLPSTPCTSGHKWIIIQFHAKSTDKLARELWSDRKWICQKRIIFRKCRWIWTRKVKKYLNAEKVIQVRRSANRWGIHGSVFNCGNSLASHIICIDGRKWKHQYKAERNMKEDGSRTGTAKGISCQKTFEYNPSCSHK